MRRTLVTAAFTGIGLLGATLGSASPVAGGGTILSYPGGGPCSTTLQACIDSASSGDTVLIVTDTPIDEAISIHRSLSMMSGTGHHGTIGGPTIGGVDVRDNQGAAVHAFLSDLYFKHGGIDVQYLDFPGDSFSLTGSDVTSNTASNAGAGVEVQSNVPGVTFTVQDDDIRSNGAGISVGAFMSNLTDVTQAVIVGNTITNARKQFGSNGISVGAAGSGTLEVDIDSNVIHHTDGCFCGGSGAIDVGSLQSVDIAVNIVGNTIDHTYGNEAINVEAPQDTSHEIVNFFDNIVTNSEGRGLFLPHSVPALIVRAGFNDFSGNGQPNHLGGYAAGSGNLAVSPHYLNVGSLDYRLRTDSPLRDAGRACTPGGLPRGDAAGRYRLKGAEMDIGAFEINAGAIPVGANIFGNGAANDLQGTSGADLICGFGGGDTIDGNAGADHLFGGNGADQIDATDGAGGDVVDGGPGTDVCGSDAGDHVTRCP